MRAYTVIRRSHPSAPNKPPFETLAGFLAAPIDKLLDAFTSFPNSDEMQGAKEELKHRDHDAVAARAEEEAVTRRAQIP